MRSEELINEVQSAGSYFFSKDTMRFFNSRLVGAKNGPMCTTSAGERFEYFVTSERRDASTPRLYTVRRWDRQLCRVEQVGGFQAYQSAAGAREAMYKAAIRQLGETSGA